MNQFSAGSVLSRGASVLFKNFIPFLVLAVLIFAPIVAYSYLSAPSPEDLQVKTGPNGELVIPETDRVRLLIDNLLNLIAQNVLAGAVAFGVFNSLKGDGSVSVTESLMKGLSRILPVIAVGLIVGIGIILGTICLLVPGVMLACAWYVAVPAAVVEQPGVIGAIKRSAFLTKGSRWAVFGIFALVFLMQLGAGLILGMAFQSMSMKTLILIVSAIGVLFALYGAVCRAVAYHDLRVMKEGANVDDLISVFE